MCHKGGISSSSCKVLRFCIQPSIRHLRRSIICDAQWSVLAIRVQILSHIQAISDTRLNLNASDLIKNA
jgi:hypothetical protein